MQTVAYSGLLRLQAPGAVSLHHALLRRVRCVKPTFKAVMSRDVARGVLLPGAYEACHPFRGQLMGVYRHGEVRTVQVVNLVPASLPRRGGSNTPRKGRAGLLPVAG